MGQGRPAAIGLLVRGALAAFLAGGVAGHAGTANAADEIEQGREVYDEFCATCHGRDMVSPGAVSFDLRRFPKDDFARFRNAVMNGKGPAMPPWREKLSDEDLTVLWAYVRGGGQP
jgi:mono/diheme cytochrome c family protein